MPAHQLGTDDLELLRQVRREQYTTARAYHEAARDRRALAVATATPDNPVLLPWSLLRPSSLLGGDDDLFDLTDGADPAAVVGAPDPTAVVPVGSDTPDPWDLDDDTDVDLDTVSTRPPLDRPDVGDDR